jgi:RsiW-degrading membrane proteinase PrsW (M82 family)
MDFIRLIFNALLPIAIIAFIIYKVDRYDKEPIKLLVLVMFLGAVAVIPVFIGSWLLGLVGTAFGEGILGTAYHAFIQVALVEEFFKWIVIILVIYKRPEFDEPLDGIVYCVFVSLGFAAVENILYLLSYSVNSPNIAFFRGILSVPGHALFGVSMGYFLSLAKYATNPIESSKYYWRSLFIPVLFHGIYDFLLFMKMSLLLLVFVGFIIYMWINGIKKLKKFAEISKATNSID